MTKPELPEVGSVWEDGTRWRRRVDWLIDDYGVAFTPHDASAVGLVQTVTLDEWHAWAKNAREVTGEVGE